MVNTHATIIGSSTNPVNDYHYLMDVTHLGAVPISGTININNIAGSIVIGSVSAHVDSIYVTSGNMFLVDEVPTNVHSNNPKWSFEYDANGNVGSVYQMIGTGSYVNTLTWIGFSGTLPGTGSRVTAISEWSVV